MIKAFVVRSKASPRLRDWFARAPRELYNPRMKRKKTRKSLWELRPGDLPDERILRAEPRLRGLENNAAFRARRIRVPLKAGEPPTNLRTVLGLHYQVAFALADAGLGARDFVLARWGALLAPRTMAFIRHRTSFLIVFGILGMFFAPADVELTSLYKTPRDKVAFQQMQAAAICGLFLFGYIRAYWIGGAPWSALSWMANVESDFNVMSYPKGPRMPLSQAFVFIGMLFVIICVAVPIGLSIVAGLLLPAFCVWEGVLRNNWALNDAGSLLATSVAVIAALLGWAVGKAHAIHARLRGPRTVDKLLQQSEEIMRGLREEEDWKRASRRMF